MEKLPTRLGKPTIVESIFEIRFESNQQPEFIPGIIANCLGEGLKILEKLPVLQIPEAIRNADENLRFSPHYKASLNSILIQFGPKVITMSSPYPYIGWNEFFPNIKTVISNFIASEVCQRITRLGQRSIDIFENDISNHIKYEISDPLTYERTNYQFSNLYKDGYFVVKIDIASEATFRNGKDTKTGPMIGIDSSTEVNIEINKKSIISKASDLHDLNKSVFFKLLKPEFIETLEPEYD